MNPTALSGGCVAKDLVGRRFSERHWSSLAVLRVRQPIPWWMTFSSLRRFCRSLGFLGERHCSQIQKPGARDVERESSPRYTRGSTPQQAEGQTFERR